MFGEVDALEFEELKQLSLLNKHINATKETLGKDGGGTMSDKSKIKYAYVEALKKGATRATTPESGLFMSLKIRSEKKGQQAQIVKFLVLSNGVDKKENLSALNLDDAYNVMSIKMQYGDTKELMVFKANDVDQEKAVETLKTIVRELTAESRMVINDPEIIDIETYTELPAGLDGKSKIKTGTVGGAGAGGAADSSKCYRTGIGGLNNCGYDSDDWNKKQEAKAAEKKRQDEMRETPTMIQRDGEKPQLKQLNLMKKKVAMILAGEYEAELPNLEKPGEDADSGSDLDGDDEVCYECCNATVHDDPNYNLLVCRECDALSNFNVDAAEYEKIKDGEAGAGAHPAGAADFMV